MPAPGTLLFLVTEDWYFWSHRVALARAARDAGWRVAVACRCNGHRARLEAEGFAVEPLPFRRRSLEPWREIATLAAIVALYRRVRPDVVHHVALKPAVYGSIAAWLTGVPAVLNAVAGMGYVFISGSPKARLLRPMLKAAFGRLFDRAGSHLVVQNEDDHAAFAKIMPPERLHLIRGSGVDTAVFAPSPEPEGVPVAALVGRMLWDKGVGEAVEAARILKRRGVALRLVLVGPPDPENPRSIPEAQLRAWHDEGVVEWWGPREDVAAVWRQAAIAVLPSYREGLPKALLEAASAGRPMVATDVPGCREIVRHDIDGLLVPVRRAEPLADALQRLAEDASLRVRLGAEGRRRVAAELSDGAVIRQFLKLYEEMAR
jgi:glycosyltransferase involved in cell wall biosynthesis